jgi:CMP-N-acetylneuraminic acid synthetase
MRALGVIPARGGSRGIPQKNLRRIAGRPLLGYTADAARGSRRLERTILSTDDAAIAEVGRTLGIEVPFMRPSGLAEDTTPMLPVLQHAVREMAHRGFAADVVVLLQPTSPLRRAEHIDAAVDLLERTGADTVVTVVEVPHQFTPASVFRVDGDRVRPVSVRPPEGGLHEHSLPEGAVHGSGQPVLRRQDKPVLYARNGPAVLAVRVAQLERGAFYSGDTRALIMSSEDSLDIDSPWDLDLLEFILSRRTAPHAG